MKDGSGFSKINNNKKSKLSFFPQHFQKPKENTEGRT